ncbi:hypothetical protein J2S49_000876 [Arcanobacterium wilhelmae]|uniref:Methionine/alanine import family NSS transporter small subunit n=1 Tax=Arcanobacterium wilhelmae TaxID=1803177 RepID=A0ABT9NAT3_9ACTO|nr:methionine/alanine import family NSS transporter small subunit [Arcanobacterium wilhelmae]MDP9800800.1 hypothetical protein [Arcanobacterium wilhelmae]WFN90176.1 methionine/alanine import family NSS transporter small subunit [Arcanobacterium wilhelmae]
MGASAVALLVVSIGVIWGGLVAASVYLYTHPMSDED